MAIITLLVLLASFFLLGLVSIYMRRRCIPTNADDIHEPPLNDALHSPTMSSSSSGFSTPNTSGPLVNHEPSSLSIDTHGFNLLLVDTSFPIVSFSKSPGVDPIDTLFIKEKDDIDRIICKHHLGINKVLHGSSTSGCSVCLSEFEEGDLLRVLQPHGCGHSFHRSCIDMWFISHTTCPLCRRNLLSDVGENIKAKTNTHPDSTPHSFVTDHNMNIIESSMIDVSVGLDSMHVESPIVSIGIPIDPHTEIANDV